MNRDESLQEGAEYRDPSPPERPDDEEATGMIDPGLDALLLTDDPKDDYPDEGPAGEIPVGLLTDPMDLESEDEDHLGPDLSEAYAFAEGPVASSDDDEQGPLGKADWGIQDSGADNEPDEPEDGPIELHSLALEPLQPLHVGDSLDEEPISTRFPTLEIDDTELPWAKERWAELPLNATFSARQSLTLVGTTLCVAGESTHLVHSRQLDALEDVPTDSKTRRILCLDGEAQRLLLLTATGQLFLWNRAVESAESTTNIVVQGGEIVSMIWQQTPGSSNLLMRLESGRLVAWNDAEACLTSAALHTARHRLRALSEIGEPRVALWQGRHDAHVTIDYGTTKHVVPLTPLLERAIADSNPLLAGFTDYVLLGVRDHGLFMRGPNSLEFSLVPGCRRLTAMAVGHMHQRATAFVGLFSELDDRAEIVTIDLSTGRAGRIAELHIHTDDAGPADDPPERARIDALLWDPVTLRLWAAGCFGLSCFSQSGATASS